MRKICGELISIKEFENGIALKNISINIFFLFLYLQYNFVEHFIVDKLIDFEIDTNFSNDLSGCINSKNEIVCRPNGPKDSIDIIDRMQFDVIRNYKCKGKKAKIQKEQCGV